LQYLNVHPLPELVTPDSLAGGTAVVIDVLRATTTIVYALAAGARAVIPCLTIEDARSAAARLPAGQALLAGERGGRAIEGFDLGNSPAEFTPASVGAKFVVLTTTNGTKALLHCRRAERVLVASFANVSAICDALAGRPRVDLVCAGTDGLATEEDMFLAGAMAARLRSRGQWQLNEAAAGSCAGWREVVGDAVGERRTSRVVGSMRVSRGGRNLIEIGMQADIETAARIDRLAIVPQFDPATGRIETDDNA
jgi:2-phosphosulfolactate phosphatase